MQPRLGGPCIAVNTCSPVCTQTRFFKSLAPAELTGLWCLLEEKSCGFSPSSFSLCPAQSDDLHFILLYFLWFTFAASNYSFYFAEHYHPVLLQSCFSFILFRAVRPFPLPAMVSFPACFEGREGVKRLCCVRGAPHTWAGSG